MNKFIGKGRLVTDVNFKEVNDKKIAGFRIAIRRNFKNKEGEYETDFFNCSAFGNTAVFLNKYFSKGQEILINGNIRNHKWQTEAGENRISTDIIIEEVEFCGNKNNTLNDSSLNDVNVTVSNDDDDTLPF